MKTLEQLAFEQGIAPTFDLDELGALWPVDDDPDELMRFVLKERAARRDLGDEPNAAVTPPGTG